MHTNVLNIIHYIIQKNNKNPKIILDEGPHYRMLVDITYLDESYFNNKTKYKYIIDSIDHFSKYYWAFLIYSKVVLNKIKSFICINKKPKIIQTDNGLKFKNHLLSKYLENEGIFHLFLPGSSSPNKWMFGKIS